jgi:hypothetical protein
MRVLPTELPTIVSPLPVPRITSTSGLMLSPSPAAPSLAVPSSVTVTGSAVPSSESIRRE